MGMFSWLQQSSVPVAVWQDEHVGTLTWSDEEDGWIGSHAGLSFCISRIRESSSSPAPALLAYAKRFLEDQDWRTRCLEEAKVAAIKELGTRAEPEIEARAYQFICFYSRKTGPAIIADVGDGPDDRAWRIEFAGDKCEGLGFDS